MLLSWKPPWCSSLPASFDDLWTPVFEFLGAWAAPAVPFSCWARDQIALSESSSARPSLDSSSTPRIDSKDYFVLPLDSNLFSYDSSECRYCNEPFPAHSSYAYHSHRVYNVLLCRQWKYAGKGHEYCLIRKMILSHSNPSDKVSRIAFGVHSAQFESCGEPAWAISLQPWENGYSWVLDEIDTIRCPPFPSRRAGTSHRQWGGYVRIATSTSFHLVLPSAGVWAVKYAHFERLREAAWRSFARVRGWIWWGNLFWERGYFLLIVGAVLP